jgi:hypothetical protein
MVTLSQTRTGSYQQPRLWGSAATLHDDQKSRPTLYLTGLLVLSTNSCPVFIVFVESSGRPQCQIIASTLCSWLTVSWIIYRLLCIVSEICDNRYCNTSKDRYQLRINSIRNQPDQYVPELSLYPNDSSLPRQSNQLNDNVALFYSTTSLDGHGRNIGQLIIPLSDIGSTRCSFQHDL